MSENDCRTGAGAIEGCKMYCGVCERTERRSLVTKKTCRHLGGEDEEPASRLRY